MPAVLLYSRFARDDNGEQVHILAFSNHPGTTCHPSNGGELGTYHCGIKFPSAEGWRALRDGVVYSMAQASVYSYVPVLSV